MSPHALHETAPAGPHGGIVDLAGHSGASVTWFAAGTEGFVRKRAGTIGQGARLRMQADKQARFAEAGAPTPRVIGTGTAGGLFFFDMEHVPSVSVGTLCEQGSVEALGPLAALASAWFDRMAATGDGIIDPARIHAKIAAVLAQCRTNETLRDAQPVLRAIGGVLGQVDWSGVPRSDCHGDLTLENILAGPGDLLTLIDFDVPELPSLWFDAAKLYQDFDGHWCLRRLASAGAGSRQHRQALAALERMRGAVDAVVRAKLPGLAERLPALVALSLLRILPYCTDKATAFYVLERIGAVLAGLDPGAIA